MMRFMLTPIGWPTVIFFVLVMTGICIMAGAMFSGATFYEAAKLYLAMISCGITIGTYCPVF